jgi:DNA-binding transcriptional regulator YiaG
MFEELVGAVDEAAAYHRGAKLDLRTTVLPASPLPMPKEAVRLLRSTHNLSQGVFARCLNVSTKLVQAWEAGTRSAEGPALQLLRLAKERPALIFPVSHDLTGGTVSAHAHTKRVHLVAAPRPAPHKVATAKRSRAKAGAKRAPTSRRVKSR